MLPPFPNHFVICVVLCAESALSVESGGQWAWLRLIEIHKKWHL
jgi:hypothetical protein